MDPSLQFLRFSSQLQREKDDIEIQRFIRNGKRSRQLFLQQEDEDLEMAEALALGGMLLSKKPSFAPSSPLSSSYHWFQTGCHFLW